MIGRVLYFQAALLNNLSCPAISKYLHLAAIYKVKYCKFYEIPVQLRLFKNVSYNHRTLEELRSTTNQIAEILQFTPRKYC